MNAPMTIHERNMATVMLMQALQGAISPNFRRVAASFSTATWKIGFWLDKEDEIDREEIQDAIDELDGLALSMENPPSKFEVVTEICSGPLPILESFDWRIIFLRREEIPQQA